MTDIQRRINATVEEHMKYPADPELVKKYKLSDEEYYSRLQPHLNDGTPIDLGDPMQLAEWLDDLEICE